MVGTLRAASENNKQNGRCTQRPYIVKRKQIQDYKPVVDVKSSRIKTENLTEVGLQSP